MGLFEDLTKGLDAAGSAIKGAYSEIQKKQDFANCKFDKIRIRYFDEPSKTSLSDYILYSNDGLYYELVKSFPRFKGSCYGDAAKAQNTLETEIYQECNKLGLDSHDLAVILNYNDDPKQVDTPLATRAVRSVIVNGTTGVANKFGVKSKTIGNTVADSTPYKLKRDKTDIEAGIYYYKLIGGRPVGSMRIDVVP